MKFSVFQLSRRGGREVNEDRMGYCYTNEAALFVLADGMGGHAEGEVAAQLALQSIAAQFRAEATPMLSNPADFLMCAAMTAHQKIQRYGVAKRMPDFPRTTLVAAVVQAGAATWVHCGDSRLYWVRDGHLLARTRDHSYLELDRNKPASLRYGRNIINRNVLFTCLGAISKPMLDISGPHLLHSGDRLLLCSDGLWSVLQEHTFLRALCAQPVNAAVPSLVDAALAAAGSKSDNVTALAVEWEVPDDEANSYGVRTDEKSANDFFASTILSIPDFDHTLDDSLDDEEIERNIAEINAAIQRAAMGRKE